MHSPFGAHLKHWRQVRRMSQLDLSGSSRVTPRHLSFIETGRSRPGQDVVLRLAEALEIPLRERNDLLRAAGLPAFYPESDLSHEDLAPFRRIVDQMLARHAPYPAFVLDRWWTIVDANAPARRMFLGGRDPTAAPLSSIDWLFEPEVRAMVINWDEVAWAGVHRLRRDAEESGGDPRLAALLERAAELLVGVRRPARAIVENPAICTRIRAGSQVLSVVSTFARFGTARAVALNELSVELVFPADDATAAFFDAAAVIG